MCFFSPEARARAQLLLAFFRILGLPSPGYFSGSPFSRLFPGDPLKTRRFRCLKCMNQSAAGAAGKQAGVSQNGPRPGAGRALVSQRGFIWVCFFFLGPPPPTPKNKQQHNGGVSFGLPYKNTKQGHPQTKDTHLTTDHGPAWDRRGAHLPS